MWIICFVVVFSYQKFTVFVSVEPIAGLKFNLTKKTRQTESNLFNVYSIKMSSLKFLAIKITG